MKISRRILALCLCVVLVVAGSILTFANFASDVNAGKGDGRNSKVENLEEFRDVLRDIVLEIDGMGVLEEDEETVSAVASNDSRKRNRTSATISFKEDSIIRAEYSGGHLYYDIVDEGTMYFADDGSFLINILGSGIMDIDEGSVDQYLDFELDFDLYFDKHGEAYIKYNTCNGIGFPVQMLNKWISVGSLSDRVSGYVGMDMLDYITATLASTKGWFSLLGDYIDEYEDSIDYDRSEDVYYFENSIMEDFIKEVMNMQQANMEGVASISNFELDKFDASMEIDLSDEETPSFLYQLNECEYTANVDGYNIDYSCETVSKYEITNIDNTVINIKNFEPYDMDELLDMLVEG